MSYIFMHFSDKFYESEVANYTYTLTCKNESSSDWIFYMYQRVPNQSNEVYSLVWFASPYKIPQNGYVVFQWNTSYNFVWNGTGVLQPGVIYTTGQIIGCDPQSNNTTTFDIVQDTPTLSQATPGGTPQTLTIKSSANIPNNTFATGIGMSGQGTFLQQALANVGQTYTVDPHYYVAIGQTQQMQQVLSATISNTIEIQFPVNQYKATATLSQEQTWSIEYDV